MSEIGSLNDSTDLLDLGYTEVEEHKCKYMTFKSGSEYFGLGIQYVQQIIQYQTVTKIPETEDYIKGLINLRGRIIKQMSRTLCFVCIVGSYIVV